LIFGFYRLKFISLKNQKAMCRKCVGTKSMTEKITEGLARGRAKKTGGVLINTFKINLFHLLKRLGFLPCGAGLAVGLIAKDGVC
jgi:hypothetical protein